MPPQKTMEPYQQSEGSLSPSRTEQESDEFDSSWDEYYTFGGGSRRRGRQSLRQSQQGSIRSKSDDSERHHFVPPQYSISSPDIRQSQKQFREEHHSTSPPRRSQRPYSSSLSISSEPISYDRYSVPASEPTYHDVDEVSLSTATSRDSSIEVSTASRERLNLFPSPMGSPVLHRGASIEMQAKRAKWAKPITENEVMALKDDGSAKSSKGNESLELLMYGDPEETMSVATGVSQQELITTSRLNQERNAKQRREKKYRKPKDKKKGGSVRILNLPAGLKGSPSKRKYQRGVAEDLPANDDVEQAPAGKQKNRLSRYASSRRRSAAASDPGAEDADRRRAWKLMASLKTARSEGQESSQSSLGASVSVTTEVSKDDLLAQAAENWIKSTEETGAAQFSADEEDNIRKGEDSRELAVVPDEDSASTNGSDEERPEEDGAFPSLDDARIPFGPTRLSFDDEVVDKEAQWQDVSPRTTDLFIDTRNSSGTWDKMSEESPVSVMAVPNRRVRQPGRATSTSQTRLLLPPKESSSAKRRPLVPPKESARRRPTSILRPGRHSGAREVSAKIEAVKSARVKFHEEVVRGELKPQQQVSHPRDFVDSYQTSDSAGYALTEQTQKEKVADTMTPRDWAAFIERDTSLLSATPESVDSLQTEPIESKPSDRISKVDKFPEVSDDGGDWPLILGESKPSSSRGEVSMFPEVPDNDGEWALDEHERASFGTFGQFEADVPMDGGSTSEEENYDFMETVAAIVIQTAVRRMIAIDLAERMLIEASLSDAGNRDVFAEEYIQTSPSEVEQKFEPFPPECDPHVESFALKSEAPFEAFPQRDEQDFEALWTQSSESAEHQAIPPEHERNPETRPAQNFTAFPSAREETVIEQEEKQHRAPAIAMQERDREDLPPATADDHDFAEDAPTKGKRNFDALLSKYETNLAAFSSMNENRHENAPIKIDRNAETVPPKNKGQDSVFPPEGRQMTFSQKETQTVPAKQERDLEILPSVEVQKRTAPLVNQERDLEILQPVNSQHQQATPLEAAVPLEAVPYHMYDVAAIQIQSTFRGWWVRDSLNVDHFCACRIQRAYRSFRERMGFMFDIYRIAIIQSLWRRKLAERELGRLRNEAAEKEAEKSRRQAARRESEKVRRLARDAERRRKAEELEDKRRRELAAQKEAEEVEAENLRKIAAQKEAEDLEARRQQEQEAARKMAEERESERLREIAAQKEAERLRMLEAQRSAEELEAERLREELEAKREQELAARKKVEERESERLREVAAQKEAERLRMLEAQRLAEELEAERLREAARKEAEKLEAEKLRIENVARDAAATRIQSHWRTTEARKECLDRLVSVLLLQSIARRWLAKKQVSLKIQEEASSRVKRATEVHCWSPVQSDSSASVEAEIGFPDVAASAFTEETMDAFSESDESSKEEELKEPQSQIHRVSSGVEADEIEGDQKWVTVSHSYDEETFVQSYASKDKSAAVGSLESKDKAEVTKLSADELIELFIHTSMSATRDNDRCVTPLRMESPVNRSAAQSVTSSAATSLVDEKACEERPKFPGRPPRQEKTENANDILDREVLLAKEKVDRMNARLSKGKAVVKKV